MNLTRVMCLHPLLSVHNHLCSSSPLPLWRDDQSKALPFLFWISLPKLLPIFFSLCRITIIHNTIFALNYMNRFLFPKPNSHKCLKNLLKKKDLPRQTLTIRDIWIKLLNSNFSPAFTCKFFRVILAIQLARDCRF